MNTDPFFACPCGECFHRAVPLTNKDIDELLEVPNLEKVPDGRCPACRQFCYVHEVGPDRGSRGGGTIQQKFAQFHCGHPEVYIALLELVDQVRSLGFSHYGIGSVWERLRWHFRVEVGLGEEFKLNNNFRSRYVRMIIQDHPPLEGFFELRRLRAK